MADVIAHDGRKLVSLDLSLAEAFTIGVRGYVWFEEGWRKCAEQRRGSLGDL